jgi:GNAT superfamily N-acetyltransferase
MWYETLPKLSGYAWRAMRPNDATALGRFELACADQDGASHLRTPSDRQIKLADTAHAADNSVLAIRPDGEIAAAGWIDYVDEVFEVRAFLDGRVHPVYRGQGIGSALLTGMEGRARDHVASVANGRRSWNTVFPME